MFWSSFRSLSWPKMVLLIIVTDYLRSRLLPAVSHYIYELQSDMTGIKGKYLYPQVPAAWNEILLLPLLWLRESFDWHWSLCASLSIHRRWPTHIGCLFSVSPPHFKTVSAGGNWSVVPVPPGGHSRKAFLLQQNSCQFGMDCMQERNISWWVQRSLLWAVNLRKVHQLHQNQMLETASQRFLGHSVSSTVVG